MIRKLLLKYHMSRAEYHSKELDVVSSWKTQEYFVKKLDGDDEDESYHKTWLKFHQSQINKLQYGK